MFVDLVTIHARGGDGGAGVVSFERRRGRPRGRPTGGSGGAGGDVILAADPSVATLLDLERRPHRRAGNGTHGTGDLRNGRRGEDLVVPVPAGTMIRDHDGTLLADLVEPGQRMVAARGGRGGRGNAAFVGPRHRAPAFAEQGEYGEERKLALELKLAADAALVGFPNSGKSTLISRVSAARPKVADYPFTTLVPHLGVVDIEGRQFVLADIPGLIEGAASGKGLGHEFLRHVERARVLVVLLDGSTLQTEAPPHQYRILLEELRRHSPELVERPRLAVLNKADLPDVQAQVPELVGWAGRHDLGLHVISAATGAGVTQLLHAIADSVERVRRQAPSRPGFVLHRPAPPGFRVEREGEGWVVRGRAAERAVALADLTVPEAADFAAERLARLGVNDALAGAGAEAGDEVRIGDIVFEYRPDDGTSSAGGTG